MCVCVVLMTVLCPLAGYRLERRYVIARSRASPRSGFCFATFFRSVFSYMKMTVPCRPQFRAQKGQKKSAPTGARTPGLAINRVPISGSLRPSEDGQGRTLVRVARTTNCAIGAWRADLILQPRLPVLPASRASCHVTIFKGI